MISGNASGWVPGRRRGSPRLAIMERGEIDGVAVAWRHRPGPLRAELAFAVGIRDETLDTLGVTDAVAALATAALPSRTHGSWERSIDVDVTEFDLTGSSDEIAGGLAALCA